MDLVSRHSKPDWIERILTASQGTLSFTDRLLFHSSTRKKQSRCFYAPWRTEGRKLVLMLFQHFYYYYFYIIFATLSAFYYSEIFYDLPQYLANCYFSLISFDIVCNFLKLSIDFMGIMEIMDFIRKCGQCRIRQSVQIISAPDVIKLSIRRSGYIRLLSLITITDTHSDYKNSPY